MEYKAKNVNVNINDSMYSAISVDTKGNQYEYKIAILHVGVIHV